LRGCGRGNDVIARWWFPVEAIPFTRGDCFRQRTKAPSQRHKRTSAKLFWVISQDCYIIRGERNGGKHGNGDDTHFNSWDIYSAAQFSSRYKDHTKKEETKSIKKKTIKEIFKKDLTIGQF